MKLATILLLIVAIEFSILIFDAGHGSDTALFGFVQNPTDWSNAVFILVFGAVAAGLSLVTAVVGTLIFGRSDTIIFASLVPVLISWCVPLASLWQLIYEETGVFGDANTLIASIIVAPLIVLAITSILTWWRQGQ